ncbi:MAG: tetraacyldisaccharide 4'-kinase [Bacteroidales bacterium]|nr:tetraacyldisaccharide 4'-kinase [Bacteroidales bacterium]
MIISNFKKYYSIYPLSILYGMGVYFRNKLFDFGILKEESFPIPIINVGNITVGGTGKTPHTEYIVDLLTKSGYKVGVLSRGYKRKSNGFQLAGGNSTASQIGDEPFQIFSKFPNIILAVDSDRVRGIKNMLSLATPPQVIVLDDAYQHRYVKPGLNILLTDYNRLFFEDLLLPAGRLREQSSAKKRADIIVVTKCINPRKEEKEYIKKSINPTNNQSLFYTGFEYGELTPIKDGNNHKPTNDCQILIISGIAMPETFENEIKNNFTVADKINYPDHHDYDNATFEEIKYKFKNLKNKEKAIIVTEKDAVKIKENYDINDAIMDNIYYLPLQIKILDNQTAFFNQKITDYVAKNQRNG